MPETPKAQQPGQRNNHRLLTPNQLVAERIAFARKLRGWTQEEAADRLSRFLSVRWSAVTFSIVERSIDGKRIRQFTADDLVALSRTFEVPISYWFTPVWTLDFPLIVTPDAPNGLSTSVMVAVLLGDEEGFDTWANELLAWAARQIGEKDPATGQPLDRVQPLPEMQDWVDTFVRLRGEMAVAKQFGDLDAAKDGLTRVLGLLELITTPTPPSDGDD